VGQRARRFPGMELDMDLENCHNTKSTLKHKELLRKCLRSMS
jgi:hypothetical protein